MKYTTSAIAVSMLLGSVQSQNLFNHWYQQAQQSADLAQKLVNDNAQKVLDLVPKEMQKTVIDNLQKVVRPRVGDAQRPDHLDALDNKQITGDNRLPAFFNSRDAFENCKKVKVYDQKLCDSSWAFSTSGMLADRFCFQSKGQIKVNLSAQDMINCNFENKGCNGGQINVGLNYLTDEGTTSEACNRYTTEIGTCDWECDTLTNKRYKEKYEKYYCKPSSFKIETKIDNIQKEIYENGPVAMSIMVYDDLPQFTSGIYSQKSEVLVGGHTLRGIGWGHDDDGSLYWIVHNSWGEDWGVNGIGKIKAGEAGIDVWALSCNPDMLVTQ